jgi:hypothetical protein
LAAANDDAGMDEKAAAATDDLEIGEAVLPV